MREDFLAWLLTAWEWAVDSGEVKAAEQLAELISHGQEPDYPLWELATGRGLIGQFQGVCGIPRSCPTGIEWEAQINYSPIIYVEEKAWRHIHGALGWSNRDHDPKIPMSMWFWSNAGNVIRLVARKVEIG